MTQITAILFDKDGTLFDFHATWGVWAKQILKQLSGGKDQVMQDMAAAIAYDLTAQRFLPHSPAIAGTVAEITQILAPLAGDLSPEQILDILDRAAMDAPLCPVDGVQTTLSALRDMGLQLGVMTNDSEAPALAHLRAAGLIDHFAFVAGADSGFGAKPDPGPLLAFCTAVGVPPQQAVMVGDSTHDLLAAKSAGMIPIGVLTGPATTADLAPHAAAVLPSISALPDWAAQQG
jgi:phosphoglycolate phosphatase